MIVPLAVLVVLAAAAQSALAGSTKPRTVPALAQMTCVKFRIVKTHGRITPQCVKYVKPVVPKTSPAPPVSSSAASRSGGRKHQGGQFGYLATLRGARGKRGIARLRAAEKQWRRRHRKLAGRLGSRHNGHPQNGAAATAPGANGVSGQAAGNSSTPAHHASGGSSLGLILGIVAGCLVAIAAVVLLWRRRPPRARERRPRTAP